MRSEAWRWILSAALLLSVGLNVGLLLGDWRSRDASREHPRGDGRERPLSDRSEVGPPPGGPPGRHRDGSTPRGAIRMGQRLGLEGESLEAFVGIQRDFVQDMGRSRRRQSAARQELRRELTSPRPDEERVQVLIAELAEIGAEIDRLLAQHVLASRELLDGEAEERYLDFLDRLGPPGSPGPRPRRR